MTRHAILPLFLIAVLAMPGVTAQADDDVLAAIPGDALSFVLFNRLEATDAKLLELAEALDEPTTGVLEALKTVGPVSEGLDEKGSAALLIMAPDTSPGAIPDPVTPLLLVPVTDYATFIKQLDPEKVTGKISRVKLFGKPFLVGRRGDYALLAQPGRQVVLEKALTAEKNVKRELKTTGDWLLEQDVAAVVTRHGIEVFSEMGLSGIREVKANMARMSEQLEGFDEMMDQAIAGLELYERIIEGARDEIVLLAGGANLDDASNLRMDGRIALRPDGEAATILAEMEPVDLNLLGGLPNEPFVVAAAGAVPEGLSHAMMAFSIQAMKNAPVTGIGIGDTEALGKMMSKTMQGIRGMSMMFGVGEEDAPAYSGMVGLLETDDAEAFLERYREFVQEMSELGEEDSPIAGMTIEPTRIGDVEGRKLSMDVPQHPMADKMPQLKEMMDAMMAKMYGPGKITTYLAPADKKTVVAGYVSPDAAIAALQACKQADKGLDEHPQVAETSPLLPADALGVAYWSPQGTAQFVQRMMRLFSQGLPLNATPDFPDTPAVGAALLKAPNELRIETVVPAETLKAGVGYVLEAGK